MRVATPGSIVIYRTRRCATVAHMIIGRRTRWRVLAAMGAIVAGTSILAGCGDRSTTPDADPAKLVGKTYLSTEVQGPQIPGGGPLLLAFGKGTISANAGCNGHGGAVAFTGGVLTTGNLVGTMMACPPPRDGADRWVTDLFGSPLSWHLDGTTLTLQRGDRKVTLAERRERPVVGTRWRVSALVTDAAVSTSAALENSKPYFEIAGDGAFAGSTGCNRMTGRARVDGDRIHLSPIATTRRACDPETADVERTVLAALRDEVIVEVDGDEMRLTNAANSAVGLRLTASGIA